VKAVEEVSDLRGDQAGVGRRTSYVLEVTDGFRYQASDRLRCCRVYVIFDSGKRVW
jgi:hypothetical protein